LLVVGEEAAPVNETSEPLSDNPVEPEAMTGEMAHVQTDQDMASINQTMTSLSDQIDRRFESLQAIVVEGRRTLSVLAEQIERLGGVKKEVNITHLQNSLEENLNDEMGLMPLVAPYIAKERDIWKKQLTEANKALEKIKQEADNNVPRMFVEGTTDKKVYSKTIDLNSSNKCITH
jgi:acetolactate synthase regulatory subunit